MAAPEVMRICVEDYLRYIRTLKRSIGSITDAIEQQDARLTAMGVHYGGMRSASPNLDKLADGVMDMIALRERLSETYRNTIRDIEHARTICTVTEAALCVWYNKVERMTYGQIAKEQNVSPSTVKRLLNQGIADIYEVMPERFRRLPKAL